MVVKMAFNSNSTTTVLSKDSLGNSLRISAVFACDSGGFVQSLCTYPVHSR